MNEEVSGYLAVKTAYFPVPFTSHPNAGVKIWKSSSEAERMSFS